MSQPGPEARISNLEKQTTSLGARIEELAADTAENFRDLKHSMHANFTEVKQERKKMTTFEEVHAYLKTQDDRFDRVETRLDRIEATMATKEDLKTMATKEDLTTMEERLLNAIQTALTAKAE